MKPVKVLVIEDHVDIVEILQYHLLKEGFEVILASDGEQGFQLAVQKELSLILLDLMLPKINGLEVCRLLKQRKETRDIPIVMLTAKGEESDVTFGLNLGADDYVVKPFRIKELIARVHAVLRRGTLIEKTVTQTQKIQIRDLTIDPVTYEVFLRNKLVLLTLTEFKLLYTLLSQYGRVFTREQLLEKVHGTTIVVVDRNIDVHITSLRKKLKDYAEMIMTVRGIGYKGKEPE